MTTLTEEQRMQWREQAVELRPVLHPMLPDRIITLCDALDVAEAKCREQEKEIERLRISLGGWVKSNEVACETLRKTGLELAAANQRVRELTTLLDQKLGTPCEQIRQQQDVRRTWMPLSRASHHLSPRHQGAVMTEKLKECPFCGSAAILQDGGGKYYVVCSSVDCFCAVGEGYDRDAMPDHVFDTPEAATTAWNARAAASTDNTKLADEIQARLRDNDPEHICLGAEEWRTILAALRQPSAAAWRPIDDGAKSGEWIILWVPGHGHCRARWNHQYDAFLSHNSGKIITMMTHWRVDLPAPPAEENGKWRSAHIAAAECLLSNILTPSAVASVEFSMSAD